jgi:hypothetical protein
MDACSVDMGSVGRGQASTKVEPLGTSRDCKVLLYVAVAADVAAGVLSGARFDMDGMGSVGRGRASTKVELLGTSRDCEVLLYVAVAVDVAAGILSGARFNMDGIGDVLKRGST